MGKPMSEIQAASACCCSYSEQLSPPLRRMCQMKTLIPAISSGPRCAALSVPVSTTPRTRSEDPRSILQSPWGSSGGCFICPSHPTGQLAGAGSGGSAAARRPTWAPPAATDPTAEDLLSLPDSRITTSFGCRAAPVGADPRVRGWRSRGQDRQLRTAPPESASSRGWIYSRDFFVSAPTSPDPLRLALTEALHLKDSCWHSIAVDAADPGTWRNIHKDNQNICYSVFPYAKEWLESCTEPEIVRPICSFLGLTVANNSYVQKYFASIGGLATLAKVLLELMHDPCLSHSSMKLAVVVTKTLNACIANNSTMGVVLAKYHTVSELLKLLSNETLSTGEKISIILTVGHCTEVCEENQCELLQNNGLPLMIQILTESQDEELIKAATFVLQNCKQMTEQLSLKLYDNLLNVNDAEELDVQVRKRCLQDNWKKIHFAQN